MRALLVAAALVAAVPVSAAPDFAPNPRQAFDGFRAINPPRADVPVGALWVPGYGPTGVSAGPDNLETARSLSSVTIDKNLQLSLSVGILQLLGIDPKARDHYTARFSDLSIVRVKDIARLDGPKGEPRIVEALKAGSVTVTSDTDIGLSGQSIGNQLSTVSGSTTNDRTRTYSIEARDMFIAIHVATPELTSGEERELHLSPAGTAEIEGYLLVLKPEPCTLPQPCDTSVGVAKLNTQTAAPASMVPLISKGDTSLRLPVALADGHGGLFDTLVVRRVPACGEMKIEGCRREPRYFGHFAGSRLQDLGDPDAKGW